MGYSNLSLYSNSVDGGVKIYPPEMLLPRYPREAFYAAELEILKELEWRILYSSPASIVRDLMALIPRSEDGDNYECDDNDDIDPVIQESLLQEALYFTELSIADYGFITIGPASIALAAIMAALESNLWTNRNDALYSKFSSTVRTLFRGIGLTCENDEVEFCVERFCHLKALYNSEHGEDTTSRPESPRSAANHALEEEGCNAVEEQDNDGDIAKKTITRPNKIVPACNSTNLQTVIAAEY